jgi:hypothetical protein
LIIAHGSANETEHWLNNAKDCDLGNSESIDGILKTNNEVLRMITSAISTIRSKQATRNLQEDSSEYFVDENVRSNDQ